MRGRSRSRSHRTRGSGRYACAGPWRCGSSRSGESPLADSRVIDSPDGVHSLRRDAGMALEGADMTDTTNGATGEPREGDVTETAAAPAAQAQAPETTRDRPLRSRRPPRRLPQSRPRLRPQRMSLPRPPLRQRLSLLRRRPPRQRPAATGTVYEPGQAPQPYHAPQYAKQAAPAPVAGATATQPGQVPPAFGGPQATQAQPTVPVAGVPNGTAPGASAPPRPSSAGSVSASPRRSSQPPSSAVPQVPASRRSSRTTRARSRASPRARRRTSS